MEEPPKTPIDMDRTVLSASSNAEIGGRYRVVKWLGSGAMGAVHLAEDSKLHRQVAIKTVRPELSRSAEFRKRIERECVLHARVGPHPHIVTLFDKFEEGDQIHLVMEYVSGEPLQHVLERNLDQRMVLPPATSLTIAAQCLEALFRIHSHGIVHRDIKPANIMVTLDDAGETCAKLMDFGIARLMDGDEQYAALTTVNSGGPGTPLYMSPEQIDSKTFGSITFATDIYAMGILLYQMFSGHPPFNGTVTELLNAHVNLRPPPLHAETQWSVPRSLEEVLDRALAKQPGERFSSAQDFRQQLMQIAGSLTKHPKNMTDFELAAAASPLDTSRGLLDGSDDAAATLSSPRAALPLKTQRGGMLGLLSVVATLCVVGVAAGAITYWALAPRRAAQSNPLADGAPMAPVEPVPSSAASATPTIVSLTPTPTVPSNPVVANDGTASKPGAPDTSVVAPSAQVSELPGNTPNISVTDIGFGASLSAPPNKDISLKQEPAATVVPATMANSASPSTDTTKKEYRVRPGDTLLKIAETNKVDYRDLQWWNNLKDPDSLVSEQTLYLYARPGLQPKDKFFADIAAKPAAPSAPVAASPPEPKAPASTSATPPEDSDTKEPPKKKSIKNVLQRIFHL